ncbi:hypothetical protein CDAR_574091 [Caerostris darwini]|uniref:Uncharacterized protein n=1 Tax=Caerostris darwini TaxID=1538125 RepID=A0AAV4T3K0_9ARAC|nr:hypothetical protein CDAR_574091 [Caerostris darwini]
MKRGKEMEIKKKNKKRKAPTLEAIILKGNITFLQKKIRTASGGRRKEKKRKKGKCTIQPQKRTGSSILCAASGKANFGEDWVNICKEFAKKEHCFLTNGHLF